MECKAKIMTRRWGFGILFLVLLGSAFAISLGEVGAQQQEKKQSLADKLGALRRAVTGSKARNEVSITHSQGYEQSYSNQAQGNSSNTLQSRLSPGSRKTSASRSRYNQDRAAQQQTPKERRTLLPSLAPFDILSFGKKKKATVRSRAVPNATSHENFNNIVSSAPRRSPPRRVPEKISDLADLTDDVNVSPSLNAPGTVSISDNGFSNRSAIVVDDISSNAITPIRATEPRRSPLEAAVTVKTNSLSSGALDIPVVNSFKTAPSRRKSPLSVFDEPSVSAPVVETIAKQNSSEQLPKTLETVKRPSDSSIFISHAVAENATPSIRRNPLTLSGNSIRSENSSHNVFSDLSKKTPAITQSKTPNSELILTSHSVPALSTEVLGPKSVLVGREANYQIKVHNNGRMTSDGLISKVRVPDSVQIVDATVSHGMTQRDGELSIEWKVNGLNAGETAILDLKLMPKTGGQINLETTFQTALVVKQAVVQIKEPKLEITVECPSEVLLHETNVYRIRVSNPGTGPAEKLILRLLPPGENSKELESQQIELLPAGKTEVFEVELAASQFGKQKIVVSAEAEGGLEARAERQVLVRHADLQVDVRGPVETYAGTVATYFFRVRNEGDAEANHVEITANIPKDCRLVKASEGHRDAKETSVVWDVRRLKPGEDYVMELHCLLNDSGDKTITLVAKTNGKDPKTSAKFITKVIAIADLKLEVSDPKGPVAIGEEAKYEVRILNRGTSAAKDVQIVGLFSEGIEPIACEGIGHTISNGRVSIKTIESLAAGSEIVFTIRAKASRAGSHVFRAEVLCSELDTKLAMEETTRFFEMGMSSRTPVKTATKPGANSIRQ